MAFKAYNLTMYSVLVVDDDPHIREVVCFALEQAGYSTCTASDGAAQEPGSRGAGHSHA